MSYFKDFEPYLNNDEEVAVVEQVDEQTYVENILRLNIGKLGKFYFSYTGSEKWNDYVYTGILEQAGRDHFIIKDENSQERILLLNVYLLFAKFNEPLRYSYKRNNSST